MSANAKITHIMNNGIVANGIIDLAYLQRGGRAGDHQSRSRDTIGHFQRSDAWLTPGDLFVLREHQWISRDRLHFHDRFAVVAIEKYLDYSSK